jgi:hypothetical protein
LKSEVAVVAPCPSVPSILLGMLSGVLSVMRASATHVAGGAHVGGTLAGT